MERIVARLAARLRSAGVRVSPGETLDAVRAVAANGLGDPGRIRAALQLTLVKSARDLPVFERVLEEFLGGGAPRAPGRDGAVDPAAILDARVRPGASGEEGERSGAHLAVDDGAEDGGELDLDALVPVDDGGDEGGPRLAVRTRRFRGEKARAPRPVNYTRGPIWAGAGEELLSRWRNEGVKPFSPDELAAMEEVVARMVRRLEKDARRSRSRQTRGRLEVAKTLQRNYRHGMVPFVRVLRRKRRERPRLVVLCDVSHSVSHASRFLLLLLHTLQRGLLDVRSFVFNRELAEVTGLLRREPLEATLERIEAGEVVDLQDDSDFGEAFVAFEREHLASLRGRPAVIVLGDGRNNYNPPRAEALGAIRERASTLLWLTPEERHAWELGDCVMDAYAPRCDRVEVVRNVEELGGVVEALLRGWRGGGPPPAREPELAPPPPLGARRAPWRHGGELVRS